MPLMFSSGSYHFEHCNCDIISNLVLRISLAHSSTLHQMPQDTSAAAPSEKSKPLDRLAAAQFLDISTRTLDRYVKSKKLIPLRKKGKLFFPVDQLHELKDESYTPHIVSKNISPLENTQNGISSSKYKILWEEAKNQLQEKEKLLMNMNHRLGFLESELKNSVPLLQSQKNNQDLEEKNIQISSLQKKLHHMQVGKILFMILFFLSLSAGFLLFLGKSLFWT